MSLAAEPPLTPQCDLDQIPGLVAGLRTTFDSGRTRSVEWRLEQLGRIKTMLSERADELGAALVSDLGKPNLEGWLADIAFPIAEIEEVQSKLRTWLTPERVRTPLVQWPCRAYIVREPLGVVLIIAPWNYPIQLSVEPLVAAIAAGNCAVVKPSEVSAHSSRALARLLPQYVDSDCITVVEGGVPETTALLAERFDHILYTGNGRVGRVVMEAAAKHLTPVTLELGGKSPCLVDSEVDLEVAARRIVHGKFLNAGQTCIAPDYVLVHESRETELLEGMKAALREFYGDDPRHSPDYARIINQQHVERLAKLLESGEVVVGGEVDAEERYIAPTLLREVSPDSPVMAEEIFGPILPVLKVPDMESGITFVNTRPKPLALYVFTRRAEIEREVISRISAGGACVNATLWQHANPNLPFGGVGESGMGAYHGRHGFETFSHRKGVVTKPTRPDPRLAYPPYTKLKQALMKRLF
jgi:aldehyde dehydrogenase (NAD+)